MFFYTFLLKSLVMIGIIVGVASVFGRLVLYKNLPKDDDTETED
jgi:hypothetical protein